MPTEPTLFGRMRALWRGILDRIGIGSRHNATKKVYLILMPYRMLGRKDSVSSCPAPGKKLWGNWAGRMSVLLAPRLVLLQQPPIWTDCLEDGQLKEQLWTGLDLRGRVTTADMAALYEPSDVPAVLPSSPR